jgi:hypothetical protein
MAHLRLVHATLAHGLCVFQIMILFLIMKQRHANLRVTLKVHVIADCTPQPTVRQADRERAQKG